VVFLFLVGELLEGVAAGKARASIQSLTTLVPKSALLEVNGARAKFRPRALPSAPSSSCVPATASPPTAPILSGESAIDEAPVTGESTPVRKGQGDTVFAGTVNGDAVLRVTVTAAAADNTIARVVGWSRKRRKEGADRALHRPLLALLHAGRRGRRRAGRHPAAAAAGGAGTEWIYKGLAILLIGCPCALVISTPAAIAASLSAGARRGLLLKGGAVLETLGKINMVALDKTGTLTEGKPKVTDIVPFGTAKARC
jgi:Cd2+/Zn2+-exporting ATPase